MLMPTIGDVATALSTVGIIDALKGAVTIVRLDGTEMRAQLNDPLFVGDRLVSAHASTVAVSLIDGSSFSLDENTQTVLDELIYEPATETGNLALTLTQGMLVFDNGAKGTMTANAVIRTASADFSIHMAGVGITLAADGSTSVTLLNAGDGLDGKVDVSWAGHSTGLTETLTELSVGGGQPWIAHPYRVTWENAEAVYRAPISILNAIEPGRVGWPLPLSRVVEEPLLPPEKDVADFKTAAGGTREDEDSGIPLIRVVREDLIGKGVGQERLEFETFSGPGGADGDSISVERRDEPAPSGRGVGNLAPNSTSATATANEDQAVTGQLTATDPDRDSLTFTVAPDGTPKNGTVIVNSDGTFSYQPDTNFSGSDSFTYIVNDGRGGTALGTMVVNIAPVADTPVLNAADVVGAEDTAIALSVSAALTDASEQLSVRVSGVPAGATLSAGTDNGDGTWTVAPGELDGLAITPPAHYSGAFNLSYEAISSVPATGETASIADTAMIVVNPVADMPILGVAPATGTEDISVPLTITTSLVDPFETGRVEISGLPDGASLNAGVDAGDGTWVLALNDLTDLRLSLPADFGDSFQLSVKAISTDGADEAATPTAALNVTMTPTGDVSLTVGTIARSETNAIVALPFDLNPAIADIDASEILRNVVVTFDQDLPSGAVVSGGTLVGRVLTIAVSDIDSASITVPADWAGEITGSAVAFTNEGQSAPSAVSLSTVAVPDVPSLSMTIVPNEAANAAARGGFVSVWEDPNLDGSGAAIIAQRYDATGNRIGAEFRVNTTTPNAQVNPSATTLANGGFVVAWDSNSQDGGNYGVYMQRYDANGNRDGTETRVNVTTAGNQQNCHIASLDGGGFVVAWDGGGAGDTQGIFARRFDAMGQPVAGEFRVSSTVSGTQSLPSLASIDGGGFVVLWQGAGSGDTTGIYGQRYSSTGSPLGTEFRANTTTSQTQDMANVTALNNGGFVVVWHGRGTGDTNAIFMRAYGANGLPVGGETLVNTFTTGSQTDPAVETLADGSFVVVWDGRGSDDQTSIYAQRFDTNGMRLGGEFRINSTTSNTQDFPSITPLADGGFVVNWESTGQDGGAEGIFGQRFTSAGTPTGGEFQVNTSTQGSQADPAASGLNTGPQYFDFTLNAAFGDYADASERHQVRVDVPDGFALTSDPSTWGDLPSGVSAELIGGDVVFTAATGSEGIETFSYSFPVVQNDLTVDTVLFNAEAQAMEIATGAVVTTTAHMDLVLGAPGSDSMSGSGDTETFYGGTGEDSIVGGAGGDYVYGGEDNDAISGGEGDDVLSGGAGDDSMSGGEGNDTFLFQPENEAGSADHVADFSSGDALQISGISTDLDDLSFVQVGNDTVVQVAGHDMGITLDDVQADQLVSYQLTPDPNSNLMVVFVDDAVRRGTG